MNIDPQKFLMAETDIDQAIDIMYNNFTSTHMFDTSNFEEWYDYRNDLQSIQTEFIMYASGILNQLKYDKINPTKQQLMSLDSSFAAINLQYQNSLLDGQDLTISKKERLKEYNQNEYNEAIKNLIGDKKNLTKTEAGTLYEVYINECNSILQQLSKEKNPDIQYDLELKLYNKKQEANDVLINYYNSKAWNTMSNEDIQLFQSLKNENASLKENSNILKTNKDLIKAENNYNNVKGLLNGKEKDKYREEIKDLSNQQIKSYEKLKSLTKDSNEIKAYDEQINALITNIESKKTLGDAFGETFNQYGKAFSALIDGDYEKAAYNFTSAYIKGSATSSLLTQKAVFAVADIGGSIIDGVAGLGGNIVGSSVGLFDKEKGNAIKDSVLDFQRREFIDEFEKFNFEQTAMGKLANKYSNLKYYSEGANAVEDVAVDIGKIAAATGLTVVTGGGAAAVFATAGTGFLYGVGTGGEEYAQSVDRENGEMYNHTEALWREAASGLSEASSWYVTGRTGAQLYNMVGTVQQIGLKNTMAELGTSIKGAMTPGSVEGKEFLKSFGKNLVDLDNILDTGALIATGTADIASGKSFEEMLKDRWLEGAFVIGVNTASSLLGAGIESHMAKSTTQNAILDDANVDMLKTNDININSKNKWNLTNYEVLDNVCLVDMENMSNNSSYARKFFLVDEGKIELDDGRTLYKVRLSEDNNIYYSDNDIFGILKNGSDDTKKMVSEQLFDFDNLNKSKDNFNYLGYIGVDEFGNLKKASIDNTGTNIFLSDSNNLSEVELKTKKTIANILNNNSNIKYKGETIYKIGGPTYNQDINCFLFYDTKTNTDIVIQKDFNANYTLDKAIESLDNIGSESPLLSSKIKTLVLTGERNPDDIYWSSIHNIDFYSAATGGSGKITYYNCSLNDDILGTLYHEAGHCLDENYIISDSIEWQKAAYLDQKFSSDYAANSFNVRSVGRYGEDFADTIKEYRKMGEDNFKKAFPNRYKYLKANYPNLMNLDKPNLLDKIKAKLSYFSESINPAKGNAKTSFENTNAKVDSTNFVSFTKTDDITVEMFKVDDITEPMDVVKSVDDFVTEPMSPSKNEFILKDDITLDDITEEISELTGYNKLKQAVKNMFNSTGAKVSQTKSAFKENMENVFYDTKAKISKIKDNIINKGAISLENSKNLKNSIIDNMPSNLTDEEKARYIYMELNKRVNYDTNYALGNNEILKELTYNHKLTLENFENLGSNRVICKGWSELYQELLKESNINGTIKIMGNNSAGAHKWIEINLNNGKKIFADSTQGYANGLTDLVNCKSGNKTGGFLIFNNDIEINATGKKGIEQVKNLSNQADDLSVMDKKLGYTRNDKYYRESLGRLEEKFKNDSLIDKLLGNNKMENKVSKTVEMINSSKMGETETYAYLKRQKNNLFGENASIDIIIDSDSGNYRPILSYLDSSGTIQYQLFTKENGFEIISKQELESIIEQSNITLRDNKILGMEDLIKYKYEQQSF